MRARRTFAAALALATAPALVAAQPALATFHEMMIREVYPGSVAHPNSEYVELQMWAPGQNRVGGHQIGIFSATGVSLGTATFSHDVSGSVNQSTLVAATAEAEAEFGFAADASLPVGQLDPAGGAVCWEMLDCVAWGDFTGAAKSPVGTPAAPGGIPDGMALRRTIEPGCPTLLEPGDDHDDSVADFSPVFPGPRPNSVAPSERPCQGMEMGGGAKQEGGSSPVARERPQTRITRRPGRRTHDRTPSFGFAASVPGSVFRCRLDRHRYRACPSPYTAPRLSPGAHVLLVEARAPGGVLDPSPARFRFTVLPRR